MTAELIDLKKRRANKRAEEQEESFNSINQSCLSYLEGSKGGPGPHMEAIIDEREIEALAERMMKHPASEDGDLAYFRERARTWLTMLQLLDNCAEEARRQLAEDEKE